MDASAPLLPLLSEHLEPLRELCGFRLDVDAMRRGNRIHTIRAEPEELIFSVLPGKIQSLLRHGAAGSSPAAQSRNRRLSSPYTKGWRSCIKSGPYL